MQRQGRQGLPQRVEGMLTLQNGNRRRWSRDAGLTRRPVVTDAISPAAGVENAFAAIGPVN